MTLITYPTRVHFADLILEEALHSELESGGCRHPLLIAERDIMVSELADRVRSGLPRRNEPRELTFQSDSDLRKVAAGSIDKAAIIDSIIAFGSAAAIELGRKCRHAQASQLGVRPLLFAIPGVDGMPNPCTRNVESWRAGLPSVLICDPTVALAAEPRARLWASVQSLVRCVESYLSQAYNPLADGIALEGVSRCLINLPKINADANLGVNRELMAVGLNAALAQEKGIGPALTISASLADATETGDEIAIARLVLPAITQNSTFDADKVAVLQKVLGAGEESLDQSIRRILAGMPMPASLSDMGIPRQALDAAAKAASGKTGLTYASALSALESIYEEAQP